MPPIPQPLDEDAEDVFWALSTATTLHSRGEHAEALRWLRRAAEHATRQNASARAEELANVARELDARLGPAVAARPSTPPPLPKRSPTTEASSAGRPPPLPPRAPSASALKPPARAVRERQGTLTGRRASTRRPSSADLGKASRPTGVPSEIPDAPIDDLDEETNVYEGKSKLAKGKKPPVASPPVKALSSTQVPSVVAAKPRSVPMTIKPTPSTRGSDKTSPGGVDRLATVSPSSAEPSSKGRLTGEIAPFATTAKVESASASSAEEKALTAVTKAESGPSVARVPMVRKATMQLVDEGFESMLESSEPPSVAVPIFVELPVPPDSKGASRPDVPVAKREPSALLSQRVAVFADPNGGARIAILDDGAAAPADAVVAIVVPFSAGDGERLATLLRDRH